MIIADWKKISCIDYPGKISTIIFVPTCTYKCPTCHAKHVIDSKRRISEKDILNYIEYTNDVKNLIDSIVVCGGEPTSQSSLPFFLRELKKRGLSVKIDTNGSNYKMLSKINDELLADYVAMDIKGPFCLYSKLTGQEVIDPRDGYQKAMNVVMNFPDYEFRTTIVPIERKNGEINFMTPKEIGETARLIYESTGVRDHKYFLQKFIARNKDEMLDEKFSKEDLDRKLWETSESHLEKCLIEARKYLPRTEIRK